MGGGGARAQVAGKTHPKRARHSLLRKPGPSCPSPVTIPPCQALDPSHAPLADRVPNARRVVLAKEPRLAALGLGAAGGQRESRGRRRKSGLAVDGIGAGLLHD